MSERSRGLALIVVVGVLGVLSVLAVAFVTMAQLERKASQQRVNAARAYLLAKSGIEDALARLGMGQDPVYKGEDWNANGSLDAGVETASQVYKPGVLDTDACPVRYALRPSFFVRDPTNLPKIQTVDGRQLGYSGALSEDSGRSGNHYALKVGASGGFYVNGGDPSVQSDPTTVSDYNTALRRMLGILAEAIYQEDHTQPVRQVDGENLILLRPQIPTGWQSFDQVRDVALGGNQAKLDALQPYLTLHAWVDKSVIAPNATVAMESVAYHSWGDIKLWHPHPDFERIPRLVGGTVVGRAPVDLSWARSKRPALIALIAGLRGLFLDETTAGVIGPSPFGGPTGDILGNLREASIANTWSASDDCHLVVNAIQAYTGPLDTWQEWEAFCDTIGFPDVDPNWPGAPPSQRPLWIADLKQAKKNLLKANFNPNTDTNKFNPNTSRWKTLDKTDLLDYSTELSLAPLSPQGGQRVSSVGRVLDGGGRLLASRTLSIALAQPQVLRLTTQKDFVDDENGNPRMPGYSIGVLSAYLSQSQGTSKTWGHALDTSTLSPPANYASSWMKGDPPNVQGTGLQIYPEPYVNAHTLTGFSINPADWDGCLQLATIETEDNDVYTVTATTHIMGLLARFDDNLDANISKSPFGAGCYPDNRLMLGQFLYNSVWDPGRPITLYPDGAFSEKDRCPAWYDHGASQGFHEVLSFWVKDDFRLPHGLSPANKGRQWVHRTNYTATPSSALDSKDQFWFLGYTPWSDAGLTSWFEVNHDRDAPDRAHDCWLYWGYGLISPTADMEDILTHRWVLITDAWDFQAAENHGSCKLLLDDGGSYLYPDGLMQGIWDWMEQGNNILTPRNTNTAATNAQDITADEPGSGHHLLSMGRHGKFNEFGIAGAVGNGADATFDEVALYDFGYDFAVDAAPSFPKDLVGFYGPGSGYGTTNAFILARNRWQDGRYYKEAGYRAPGAPPLASGEAGSWISALLSLPQGAVLQRVFWTWYRPPSIPSLTSGVPGFDFSNDYAEVELLSPDGARYLWDPLQSRSTRAPGWTNQLQSWQPGRVPPGAFRARVVFRRGTGASDTAPADNVSVPPGTPLLDSPVFDDLTFVYTLGPGIPPVSWQEGE